MSVSKRLRFEVLRRDSHTCRYCGATSAQATLTVDHVIPVALGGTDVPENLVAACAMCNSGKSSVPADAPLVNQVAEDALRWSRAMHFASLNQAAKRDSRDFYVDAFHETWAGWGIDGEPLALPGDWVNSVRRFFDAGLEADVVDDAVRAAMTTRTVIPDNVFKYFCGICWRTINERIEIARDMLDKGVC